MLKIGIIGEDNPGTGLCELISGHTTCTYSGSYISDPDLARKVLSRLNLPVFTDYQAFLSNCAAIVVESTGDINPGNIVEALRNSKHILLDKPLNWSDEDLEYLFRLAEEANTLLQLRETFLFHPVITAAKPFIHGPAFIDYQIGISSGTPVDSLQDVITRAVFQCLDAIFNLNPGRVSRHTTVFSPDLFGFPGVIHGRIEFDNGCIANITCNGYAEQDKSVCYIYQENRHAILNFLNNRLVIKDRKNKEEKPKSFTVPLNKADPEIENILHFTSAILNKSYHLQSPDRQLRSFLLARQMIEHLPAHELPV